MTIHDLATNVLNQLIDKAESNKRETGHWWDEEAFIYTAPTEQELRSRLASVERRLEKADTALEQALSAEELDWHRFLKTEPRSMDDIQRRKQAIAKLNAALDMDEDKLDIYRKYRKLSAQQQNLSGELKHSKFEDFDVEEATSNKANHSFQLVIDWPNEVESSMTASGITTLIHTALHNAGYKYEDYGFTSPISYFSKGKLALEIDDQEERFRFDSSELDAIDWQKVKKALADLKPEIGTSQGWKRRPTGQGEILERIAPADETAGRTDNH